MRIDKLFNEKFTDLGQYLRSIELKIKVFENDLMIYHFTNADFRQDPNWKNHHPRS